MKPVFDFVIVFLCCCRIMQTKINMHFLWGVGFLSKNQSYTVSCDRLENLSLLFTIGKSKNGKGEVGVPNSPLSQFALGFPSSLVTQNP